MQEAYVELLCPSCAKNWEVDPTAVPDHDSTFACPDCGAERRTAEFARTGTDLETMKRLQEQ